jgi:histone H2A
MIPSTGVNVDGPEKLVTKKKAISKSQRAGLLWPISRVNRHIKSNVDMPRVAAGAPVYLAGAMESIIEDILNVATEKCKSENRRRITLNDVVDSIRSDNDLHQTLSFIRIYGGVRNTKVSEILKTKKQKLKAKSLKATKVSA